jgi:hypothetical protein
MNGFFLRAESFFNLATDIEEMDAEPSTTPPIINSYGGRSLHEQSHGESFLTLLQHRFRRPDCRRQCGAGEAIGGYQRGAAQARSGVDQNYQPELGANRQLNVSQVDAAGQIRSTAIGAAKLREAAAVIAAVGREI